MKRDPKHQKGKIVHLKRNIKQLVICKLGPKHFQGHTYVVCTYSFELQLTNLKTTIYDYRIEKMGRMVQIIFLGLPISKS